MFNLFTSVEEKDSVKPDIFPARDFEINDLERTFARVFLSDDGKKILTYLQKITMHKTLGPHAEETQLRYLEGQRSIVSTIIRLVNRRRG